MAIKDVDEYLRGQFKNVQGWCVPELWQSIQPLYEGMAERGQLSSACEIGVHHGKFFIGLAKMVGCSVRSVAIDLFDMQEFNLDGSGKGNLEVFRSHLDAAQLSASVDVVAADSLALDEDRVRELRRSSGGFSFFSVDGGHAVENTIRDILTATALTRSSGIIFVDDYYNPDWPGVQEGVCRLYSTSTPSFVPLLFTCNKLFLCHLSRHDAYLAQVEEFLRAQFPSTIRKRVRRFGYDTLTVRPKLNEGRYVHF